MRVLVTGASRDIGRATALCLAGDHDVAFVEGQGALVHPAYSGVTTSILHGSQPDSLVLCHNAGNETFGGYDDFALPSPAEYVGLYESMAVPISPATVDAGMLNTADLDPDEAEAAVADYADEIDAPATDPVRYDADDVLDALL